MFIRIHNPALGAFFVKCALRLFFFTFLLFLILAQPVFASEPEVFGNEVPHAATDERSYCNTKNNSGDSRDSSSGIRKVTPKFDDNIQNSPFPIFFITLLAFIPVGIIIRGIYILTRKDYKVKWEMEEWNISQVFVIFWLLLSVCSAFAMHGKSRIPETHNMYFELFETLLSFLILYWGGFWKIKK